MDDSTLDRFNLTVNKYDDIMREMKDHKKQEGARGLEGPFRCLNYFYTVKDSGVTDWTGHPGSGKTYFCLEYLMSMAERYGKRYALFLPDLGERKDVYEKLFKMKTGFDFTNKFKNLIPEDVMYRNLAAIMYSFPVLQKKDLKVGVKPEDLWEYTTEFKDDEGPIDGCLGDSWKNFKHEYSGREDLYLDSVLAYRNELSEKYNKHFHTIAHAAKIEIDKAGKRRVPNASDIKGGGSWEASGKNIITVDFPDKTKTGVNIFVNKVKPESVGQQGSVLNTIYLDKKRGRYFEFINSFKYYANDYLKIDKEEKTVDPNQIKAFDMGKVESEDAPF